MDALQEPVDLKVPAEKTELSQNESSSHNPGLRALLSIKSLGSTLQKDYEQLLLIETSLEEADKTGLSVIEDYAGPDAGERWKLIAVETSKATNGIKTILNTAKENIEKKVSTDVTDLWQQLGLQVTQLKEAAKNSVSAGYKALPEIQFIAWEKEFVKVQEVLVQAMTQHVNSCRVLLQMIEKYSPDELNKISKIIVDKIPADFTYEEALVYQNDYYKALVNFKKEFKEEKNLWDRFLDILAGGTHQPPSERIMFERWIEGEKGEL